MAELICELMESGQIPFQDAYDKLELLLTQGQFELLPGTEGNLRLVYLMNDAVESFLVFEHARITGTYLEDEEVAYATLDRNENEYVLICRQKETVFSLFFTTLTLETYLFDYGKIGHFWVEKYEYLRQLEYRIAILRDKREYLGEEYCSVGEVELSWLAEFPPLNYCCYPAVPKKYALLPDPDWKVTERGIASMKKLAKEAGDTKFLKAVEFYARHPNRFSARWIADLLTWTVHAPVVDLLNRKLAEEAAGYPGRVFEPEEEKEIEKIRKAAEKRRKELEASGKTVELLTEEPFVIAKDSLEYKIHLMIWNSDKKRRSVEIETLEIKGESENDI